jgi:hypothetical protein
VSFGEFRKKIDRLMPLSPQCTLATITAFLFSLPNLECLLLFGTSPKMPPPILPHVSQRMPRIELQLHAAGSGVGATLAQCGLKLSLIVSDVGLEPLTLSSEVIVELQLFGVWLLETLKAQK